MRHCEMLRNYVASCKNDDAVIDLERNGEKKEFLLERV